MRHELYGRLTRKEITPRRLAASKRALAKERNRLALFAAQVEREQETPEQRIARFDSQHEAHVQRQRDLAARQWRQGRAQLAALPDELRAEALARWDRSYCPARAHYFADFMHQIVKRLELQPLA